MKYSTDYSFSIQHHYCRYKSKNPCNHDLKGIPTFMGIPLTKALSQRSENYQFWRGFQPHLECENLLSPLPLFKNSCITPLTLDYQDEDKPDILMMSSILIAVGFFFLGISNTIENREIKQLIIETQLIIENSPIINYSVQ